MTIIRIFRNKIVIFWRFLTVSSFSNWIQKFSSDPLPFTTSCPLFFCQISGRGEGWGLSLVGSRGGEGVGRVVSAYFKSFHTFTTHFAIGFGLVGDGCVDCDVLPSSPVRMVVLSSLLFKKMELVLPLLKDTPFLQSLLVMLSLCLLRSPSSCK